MEALGNHCIDLFPDLISVGAQKAIRSLDLEACDIFYRRADVMRSGRTVWEDQYLAKTKLSRRN